MRVAAVVSAAGMARRFGGRAKALLPCGGRTLLHRLLETVSVCGFAETFLVTGYEKESMVEAAREFPAVRCVGNPRFAEGLGTSLACGVRALGEVDGVAFFLADKPFVSPETVRALLAGFAKGKGSRIVFPLFRDTQGHPVIFPNLYRSELEMLEGERGAKGVLLAHMTAAHAVETGDAGTVEDVDTPEAYEALRAKYETPG
jgi:molybdenum cofactor cytidylyltransferase